jgi:hypothetical protein
MQKCMPTTNHRNVPLCFSLPTLLLLPPLPHGPSPAVDDKVGHPTDAAVIAQL